MGTQMKLLKHIEHKLVARPRPGSQERRRGNMSLKHWPHTSLERTVFTFPREIPQKVGFRKTQCGGRASG